MRWDPGTRGVRSGGRRSGPSVRDGLALTGSPAHSPVPAAAAPVRGLPRRVGALQQRRPLPAPLLRPRRAAGLRAVAARPGQLPRVGGAPQRRGPGDPTRRAEPWKTRNQPGGTRRWEKGAGLKKGVQFQPPRVLGSVL